MRINHVRRGSGEPLVLLHGIGHRWQAWLPVLDRLAAHHEVTAIDLPGFGQSPRPPGGTPNDMPAAVATIGEFFQASGLDRPHVAGYSLGGAISLALAAANLVRTATVFCPAGFFTPAERRRALLILKTLRASCFLPAPWGSGDRILPPRQAERARQRLPRARHVLLPDCGHVPMSDDPELVTTLILETTGAAVAAHQRNP